MLERLRQVPGLGWCAIVIKPRDGIYRISKKLRQFGWSGWGKEGTIIVAVCDKMCPQYGTNGFSAGSNREMGAQFTQLQSDAFKVKEIFYFLICRVINTDLIGYALQV